MPFYEYQCSRGHVIEILRPIDRRDDPVTCAHVDHGEQYGADGAPAKRILSPTPTTFVCAGGRKL